MRNSEKTTLYRAAWILPVVGEPLENGEIVVENGRITEVRAASNAPADRDFGHAILMPGLVNVHTHLDYTVMRGILEDIEFFPWIRELTARKSRLSSADWEASAIWGAAEGVAGGVTTLGDCTDSGAALVGAKTLGMRGIIYQEVFGIDTLRTVPDILAELQSKVERMTKACAGTHLQMGISPHAPYTVRAELFRALSDYARNENLPVCIHAAESRAEAELIHANQGAIAAMFARRGIAWQATGGSTAAYLDTFGILTPQTLLVHGVQVSASDRYLIAERGSGWAFCPKSNAKLGNGVAPLGILGRSLPNPEIPPSIPRIGLGSDSVASNNTMDLFEEMRFGVLMQRGARHRINALTAKEAVEMATLGGAKVLGLDAEIGSLEPGKRADMCVVGLDALHTLPAYDPYNALVYAASASDVLATFIEGELRYDAALSTRYAKRFPGLNLAPVRENLNTAAQKMRAAEAGE